MDSKLLYVSLAASLLHIMRDTSEPSDSFPDIIFSFIQCVLTMMLPLEFLSQATSTYSQNTMTIVFPFIVQVYIHNLI